METQEGWDYAQSGHPREKPNFHGECTKEGFTGVRGRGATRNRLGKGTGHEIKRATGGEE